MSVQNLQTEDYIPRWTTCRFVVLDVSERWTSAIHREVLHRLRRLESAQPYVPAFDCCTTARDVLLCSELRNTVGLILFAEQAERQCLTVLGGLIRRRRTLPILVVCDQTHDELMPVMFEAGADTILYDIRNDVCAGDWCLKILDQYCGQ